MTESSSKPLEPDAGSIRATLEAHASELAALPSATLRAPRVTRMRAIQQTSALLGAFAALDSQLLSIYSTSFCERLRETAGQLPVYRDLFVAADLALELPWSPATKVQREQLTLKVRSYDATLTRWVGAAIDEAGTESERAIAALIRPKSGRQDDAEDTIHWIDTALASPTLLALLPKKVVASMPAVRADAHTLLLLLGVAPGNAAGPGVVRRQAYTLFANAYDLLVTNGAHAAQQLGIDAQFEALWPGPSTPAPEKADAEPAAPATPPIKVEPVVN